MVNFKMTLREGPKRRKNEGMMDQDTRVGGSKRSEEEQE